MVDILFFFDTMKYVEVAMELYEEPKIEVLDLESTPIFTGCSAWEDDDDSCYAGHDDNYDDYNE